MPEVADWCGGRRGVKLVAKRQEEVDGAQVRSREPQAEPTRRADSPSDPELREALARVLAGLEQAKRLSLLDGSGDEDRRRMLERMADDLMALDLDKLGRDAANELADAFDRALIGIGDDVYLFEELQRERFFHNRDRGAEIWTGLYREEQPALVRFMLEGSRPGQAEILQARHWLLGLRWTRTARDRQRLTREQLKRRVLWLSGIAAFGRVAIAALAAGLLGSDWEGLGLAVSAGALGAGVNGTYRLRDEVQRGRAVREFRATMFAQLALGAAAGLFVALVIESRLVRFGAGPVWSQQGVAAFVAGFSEAYFRGVVGQVRGSGDDRPERRVKS